LSLNLKQITGIKNLVAAAVANLKPEQVKIVSQDGVPLGEEDGEYDSDQITQQIRYKRDAEHNLEEKIINVLSPIVGGSDKVVAKVTIDFDFARKDLKDYFSEFIWYRPTSKNVKINPIYNDLIKSIDKIKASRKK